MFQIFDVVLKLLGTGRFILEEHGAIPYGGTCKDGSHDHRTNKGGDRTPRQREGDAKRRKNED